MRSAPRTCIVTAAVPGVYETFVRAHIEKLPNVVAVICGYPFPELFLGQGEGGNKRASLKKSALKAVFRRERGLERAFVDRTYRRLLMKCRAEVVLAEFGTTAAQVANACESQRIPLVAHFHGADCYKRSVLEQVSGQYPHMFGVANAIIAVSRDMQARLKELGAAPSKICYVPYGVDFAGLPTRTQATQQTEFIAVGRFVEKKAPYLTLLAFANVHKRFPGARLVFVGDGPLLESCAGLARGLGVSDNVSFVGRRSHGETLSLLAHARCFVQHSLTAIDGDSEGTPNAVLEASALGIPVIATRHAGIIDAVLDGSSGYLVDEFNVEDMSRAMQRILEEPQRAEDMGRRGRKFMLENYSQERQIAKLAEVLTQTVKCSNTTGEMQN